MHSSSNGPFGYVPDYYRELDALNNRNKLQKIAESMAQREYFAYLEELKNSPTIDLSTNIEKTKNK